MKVDDSVSQPFSQSRLPSAQASSPAESAPTLSLLHACFLLAGFGTMLLGPILPLLARTWQLTDSQLGLLLLSQFIGATLGGVTVGGNKGAQALARDLLFGLGCASLGLFSLAAAVSRSRALPFACAALLLAGFGIGRMIAANNILVGQRYTDHRASALTRLNLSFALGALLSPLLAAWLITVSLTLRLGTVALVLLGAAVILAVQCRTERPHTSVSPVTRAQASNALPLSVFLYFATLLFIYGGLETCLSGWLSTYALRYGQSSLTLSAYIMVLLLCGLTAGRAISAWLLQRLADSTLQRAALLLTAALAAALATVHRAATIAGLAVLLGITLAPVFPVTFAQLMPHRPSARQAGIVLAASGLGAAAIPALMGLVSTRTGSLRLALVLPVAVALLMLLLTTVSAFSKPRNGV